MLQQLSVRSQALRQGTKAASETPSRSARSSIRMNTPLAFFRRPGVIAVLDGELDIAPRLTRVLAATLTTLLFVERSEFIEYALAQVPFLQADLWLQEEMVSTWARRVSSLPDQVLSYWSRHTERYALLAAACVVRRHSGGSESALTLKELAPWPGPKVVISQVDPDYQIRDAFNRKELHQFVQLPNATDDDLSVAIYRALGDAFPGSAGLWPSTFTAAQLAALRPASEQLAAWADSLFAEYVAIGEPFGILGLSAEGRAGFLQLIPPGKDGRLPERLTDGSIREALGHSASRELPVVALVGSELGASLFWLDDIPAAQLSASGYAAWRRRQPGCAV
jgi:hypothetical protein